MSGQYTSLVDLMQQRARTQPSERALLYLDDKGHEQCALSFSDLERGARKIGSKLSACARPGDRALLVFPPGLDFVVAFFACLYAGLIAVPIMPPRKMRLRDSAFSIAQDCRPTVCLTVKSMLPALKDAFSFHPSGDTALWVLVDGDEWVEQAERDGGHAASMQAPTHDSLAFLQYTSGSTSAPKGVMVSHGNLLSNLAMIEKRFGNERSSTYVSWVPLYHDMGLILNVLQAFYVGALCVLMAPVSFMQRPLSWLRTIQKYGAKVAGAPNFAFDLCVERYRPGEFDDLDLSCWKIAFNGAEPVCAETLDRFTQVFARHGFRGSSFYPCYGMAEATLLITGGAAGRGPLLYPASIAEMKQNRVQQAGAGVEVKRLVGCGHALLGEEIAIVDPATGARASPRNIGEIWVRGRHVARGYWEKPEATGQTFGAQLAGEAGPCWLRTGDLGWCDEDGELYISGRLKDLIIIRGVNHYPQDIERTMEQSSPALRPHCNAAFSVFRNDIEMLVVVQEVERCARNDIDIDDVLGRIRSALVQQYELSPAEIILIRTGTIPKTTSGKIRRALTRELWLAGQLERIDAEQTALKFG